MPNHQYAAVKLQFKERNHLIHRQSILNVDIFKNRHMRKEDSENIPQQRKRKK
jgi:hypothetical protein